MAKRALIWISGFAVIVALATYIMSHSLSGMLSELGITLVCGVLGVWFTSQLNTPIFFKLTSLKTYRSIVVIAMLMIVVNTISWNQIPVEQLQLINNSWFNMFDSPFKAVLLSMRAGINEEIIYRLFAFGGIIWIGRSARLFNKFTIQQITLLAGVLSSALFAVFHTSVLIPWCMGLFLTFIYYHTGLVPVMIVHTLTDLIPFLMVALKLSR